MITNKRPKKKKTNVKKKNPDWLKEILDED